MFLSSVYKEGIPLSSEGKAVSISAVSFMASLSNDLPLTVLFVPILSI